MKKLNKNAFWAIVKDMNWPSDCDSDRISAEIEDGKYGNKAYMITFLRTWNTINSELNKAVDSLSDDEYKEFINESDDGLSDLVAHVIGRGKIAYNKVIKDPTKFSEYKQEARESFSYSFQIIYDWIEGNKINITLRDLEYKKEQLLDKPYREVASEVTAIEIQIDKLIHTL